MSELDSEWQRKGATLSDKTARKEFRLTQDEIVQAIRAGKLQYRQNSIHGNPFLRLLRREVEMLVLVEQKHAEESVEVRHTTAELARIDRELERLKARVATLQRRRARLLATPTRACTGLLRGGR